jgi:hypothetical protein
VYTLKFYLFFAKTPLRSTFHLKITSGIDSPTPKTPEAISCTSHPLDPDFYADFQFWYLSVLQGDTKLRRIFFVWLKFYAILNQNNEKTIFNKEQTILFEMSSFSCDYCIQTPHPIIYCSVDHVLVKIFESFHDRLFQRIH